MGKNIKVRATRDGDQFHYLWAANRCLKLLLPQTSLVAITIEGPSVNESLDIQIQEGEEVIDVAEYYGSEEIDKADKIHYFQLKHSTLNASEPWAPSGLEHTIFEFAKRYKKILNEYGSGYIADRVRFSFISNRPIHEAFCQTITAFSQHGSTTDFANQEKLEKFTGLSGDTLCQFCKALHLTGGQSNYIELRQNLNAETQFYLPGLDANAPIRLKELITGKALSDQAETPAIRKEDVLRALGVVEEQLYPAPSRIEKVTEPIPRGFDKKIVDTLCKSPFSTFIVHGAGGSGKTVFAGTIGSLLPQNSIVLVYDCYANGEYRQLSKLRHTHSVAFTQLSNELAGIGLCYPLIPNSHATDALYMKAFIGRLKMAVKKLQSKDAKAMLLLVVDAADNAEMAAAENIDRSSFIKDLLRESLPQGVKLVALCRTHRISLLEPPASVTRIEIVPFELEETKALLLKKFPTATEVEIQEFHERTSKTPRVQAKYLSLSNNLQEILSLLGPNTLSSDDQIALALQQSLEGLIETHYYQDKIEIEHLCCVLSALRPLVPLDVLANATELPLSFIKDFVNDMGHALLLVGNAVQFKDEPTETWFYREFTPTAAQLHALIGNIKDYSQTSAYTASILPFLMLRAGQLDELVELALSGAALPMASPTDKREIEIRRLQYALHACLRQHRHKDAAKLAIKAGIETSADKLQRRLFKENTDLIAQFYPYERILEVLSSNPLEAGWMGSHYAYEACLLSYFPESHGEASSRLRMANSWLQNVLRLPKEKRRSEQIEADDIAAMALARLNLAGVSACAEELLRWRPQEVAYFAGRIVAERLLLSKRLAELDELATVAAKNVYLLLAIITAQAKVNITTDKKHTKNALFLLLRQKKKINLSRSSGDFDADTLDVINKFVLSCIKNKTERKSSLVKILNRYLQGVIPNGTYSLFSKSSAKYLFSFALRSTLEQKEIIISELAPESIKEEIQKEKESHYSQDAREFTFKVSSLLHWYLLFVDEIHSESSNEVLLDKIEKCAQKTFNAWHSYYGKDSFVLDDVILVWFRILVLRMASKDFFEQFLKRVSSLNRKLYIPTLVEIVRLSANTPTFEQFALKQASDCFDYIKSTREEAESKLHSYIELARAIFPLDQAEAKAFFNKAAEDISQPGYEITDLWYAMLALAENASDLDNTDPKAAYLLARCCEVFRTHYITRDKHLDWSGTINAIFSLCPARGFSILSRWRERNFGFYERNLSLAVEFLLRKNIIEPRLASSFLCFNAEWDSNVFQLIMEKGINRQKILDAILPYLLIKQHSPSFYTWLYGLREKYDLIVPDVSTALVGIKPEVDTPQGLSAELSAKNEEKNPWELVFNKLDLSTPQGISEARERFLAVENPGGSQKLYPLLLRSLKIGSEPQCIRTIMTLPQVSMHEFHDFLNAIPDSWRSRQAIRTSLSETIPKAFEKYAREIYLNSWYESLPLQLCSELSGVPKQKFINIILESIGSGSSMLSNRRLFSLVDLLVPNLSAEESRNVLHYTFSLFDEIISEEDADGKWDDQPTGSLTLDEAIAGYLWSSLGSPEASIRWEAAHMVKVLVSLEYEPVLAEIIAFAQGKSADLYLDRHFYFYAYNAKQWLLIALARGCKEKIPDVLTNNRDFFKKIALSEDHVLLRQSAATIALNLFESAEEKLQFGSINTSTLKPIQTTWGGRMNRNTEPIVNPKEFGWDFDQYWFKRFDSCFDCPVGTTSEEIYKIIVEEWKLDSQNLWQKDQRHKRGIFEHSKTRHSHGSYPECYDLKFYLLFHALMIAAGRFLNRYPVLQRENSKKDDFEEWLESHSLTRHDGFWLSDRRDLFPLYTPSWKTQEIPPSIWPWSIRKEDFEEYLYPNDLEITIDGRWCFCKDGFKEIVEVSSGLINPEQAEYFVKAWQLTDDLHRYYLPQAGETERFGKNVSIKGWVATSYHDMGIDRFDPWAKDITFPASTLASSINKKFRLACDEHARFWWKATDPKKTQLVTSHIWRGVDPNYDDSPYEYGNSLKITKAFLQDILRIEGKTLIVCVEIERKNVGYSSKSQREYEEPYFRIFAINAAGVVFSL